MASLRPPSAWADAQRAFHLAYDADPGSFERQPVAVTWLTRGSLDPMPQPDPLWDGAPPRTRGRGSSPLLGIPHVLGGFLWRLLSSWRYGVTPDDGLEVTVTRTSDGAGMTFNLADDPAPSSPQGTSTGVLVGELGMNAVACLEIDGRVLWPIGPPIERRHA